MNNPLSAFQGGSYRRAPGFLYGPVLAIIGLTVAGCAGAQLEHAPRATPPGEPRYIETVWGVGYRFRELAS